MYYITICVCHNLCFITNCVSSHNVGMKVKGIFNRSAPLKDHDVMTVLILLPNLSPKIPWLARIKHISAWAFTFQ